MSYIARRTKKSPKRLICETLESRLLLAVTIPSHLSFDSATQAHFVSPQSVRELNISNIHRALQFSVDHPDAVDAVFSTRSAGFSDLGLAIYDGDGNLLAKADDDANPTSHANETLSIRLEPKREYFLALIPAAVQSPTNITLDATLSGQELNSDIQLAPNSGQALLVSSNGSDWLTGPTDVNYHRLTMTNAGSNGVVVVSPVSNSVEPFGSVFRRDHPHSPWQLVSSGGSETNLPVVPANGRHLTDSEFLFAVSPAKLSTPGGAIKISANAEVLASATVVPPTAELSVPQLHQPGKLRKFVGKGITANGTVLTGFRTAQSGVAEISLTSTVAPVVSVYSEDGLSLLKVVSRTSPVTANDPFEFDLQVDAGSAYILRVGTAGNSNGVVQLTVELPISLANINLSNAPFTTTIAAPHESPGFYHVPLNGDADLMVIEVESANGPANTSDVLVTLIGGNSLPQTYSASLGTHLWLPIDMSQSSGPFDVQVQSTSGSQPLSVRIGQIEVPQELSIGSLPGSALDWDGKLHTTLPHAGFGQLQGRSFYNLVSEESNSTQLAAEGVSARPLLALYEEFGGSLQLIDWAMPDETGRAEINRDLTFDQHHGLVTIPLSILGTSPTTIDVAGPIQTGVGVGMVPSTLPYSAVDFEEEFSSPNNAPFAEDTGPWHAELNIRQVVLENAYEQHLWRTLLPLHLLDAGDPITITLEPNSLLGVVADVYRGDRTTLLTSLTSTNGIESHTTLSPSAVDPGETLYFHVQSLANQLDDGTYSLSLKVETENPHPFEVVERYWRFQGEQLHAVDDPFSTVLEGVPPKLTCDVAIDTSCLPQPTAAVGIPIDIPLSQWGHGFVESNFTNGETDAPYQLDVFRFRAPVEGSIRVWTELLDDNVNTNLRLYRHINIPLGRGETFSALAPLAQVNSVDESVEFVELLPNFDWFPADRSKVDAQSLIVDASRFEIEKDQWLYAVVKNQEGSSGKYRIHADVPGRAITASVLLPADKLGKVTEQIKLPATGLTEASHHIAIQVPHHHNGMLEFSQRATSTTWSIHLFDALGSPIPHANSASQFKIPNGPQLVYARMEGSGPVQGFPTTFDVSTTLGWNARVQPPPTRLPDGPLKYLGENPWGDGIWEGSLAGGFGRVSSTKLHFTAAPDPFLLRVEPTGTHQHAFRWGLYRDDELIAWNQTQFENNTPIEQSLWTRIGHGMPDLASVELQDAASAHTEQKERRLANRDIAFHGAVGGRPETENWVLYIEPVGVAGTAKVTLDASRRKPLRHFELTIDPRDGGHSQLTPAGSLVPRNSSVITINPPVVSGDQWTRLFVPSSAHNVALRVSRHDFADFTSAFHYDVFDVNGDRIAGGIGNIPIIGAPTVTVPLPITTADGADVYYVRVASTRNPDTPLRLRATASLATAGAPAKDVLSIPASFPQFVQLNPEGHGHFKATDPFFPLWVGAAGDVTITASEGNAVHDIQIYQIQRFRQSEALSESRLVLVDYANKVNDQSPLQQSLTVSLDPGAYAVRIIADGKTTVDIDAPQPTIADMILDGSFGLNALPGMQVRSTGKTVFGRINGVGQSTAVTNILPEFRQELIRVTAPAGALGAGSAEALAIEVGNDTPLSFGNFGDHLARFAWWRKDLSSGSYKVGLQLPGFIINPGVSGDGQLDHHIGRVDASTRVAPGEEIFISLQRENLDAAMDLTANFPVPTSGTPDLFVQPIQLTPNQGETKVGITVTNIGYAPAWANTSHYRIRNRANLPPLQWSTAELQTSTLGPFGTSTRALAWDPVTNKDEVEFIADVEKNTEDEIVGDLAELDELNNSALETMASVNFFAPEVLHFALVDPNKDGMTGVYDAEVQTWGRYISGIAMETNVAFQVRDLNGNDTIYRSYLLTPNGAKFNFGAAPDNTFVLAPGNLDPTTAQNPNDYVIYVEDIWGLESKREIRRVHVVPKPKWLTSSEGISAQLKFNPSSNGYDLSFENRIVDYDKTLNQITGLSVPFIGEKKNQFLVSARTEGFAALNPDQEIIVPLEGAGKLKLLGVTVFDEEYDGSGSVNEHVSFVSNVFIDSMTVESTAFTVGLKLSDIPIVDEDSPEIKLFSFGVPGLASLNANLLVNLKADLDAGLTIAFDPTALIDPSKLNPLGVARPTYVGVNVNPSLVIEGEAEVLGFLDIASLSGSIGIDVQVAAGLSNDGSPLSEVVEFSEFFNESSVEIGAAITIGASAQILGFEVWSEHWKSPNLFTVGDVYTWEDYDNEIGQAFSSVPTSSNTPFTPPSLEAPDVGTSPVRGVSTLASPQLLLNGNDGLFVQTVKVNDGRSNLAFAKTERSGWQSELTILSQPEHVIGPELVATGDSPNSAVLVYQATAIPNLLAPQVTIDDALKAQEIRYRYFDGNRWSNEQTLEANGRFDGHPAVAFNSQGQGVLAWTHNTSSTPLRSPATNEIMASLWNSTTKSWMPPTQITNDVSSNLAADLRPTVHMSDDGIATIAWLRNETTAHQSAAGEGIWTSQFTAGTWGNPTRVPNLGSTDSRFTQVAIDGARADRTANEQIHILAAETRYSDLDGDPSTGDDVIAESRLLHRASPLQSLQQASTIQVISEGENYSYVDTVHSPSGEILAYWQASDGRETDVFGASLNSRDTLWTPPIQLSDGTALETAPTIAFDSRSRQPQIQLIFDQTVPVGSTDEVPKPTTFDTGGIPMAGTLAGSRLQALPELSFARPLTFAMQTSAVIGSTAVATATIANTGMAATDVTIDFRRVDDNVALGSQTIHLSPGGNYVIEWPIKVVDGSQTIEARLTASSDDGAEMLDSSNNVSSDTIVGRVDLVSTHLAIPAGAMPGQSVPVEITVENNSGRAITKPFVVSLYASPVNAAGEKANYVGEQTVSSLGSNTATVVSIPWQIPLDSPFVHIRAIADAFGSLQEASESNNSVDKNLFFAADLAVTNVRSALVSDKAFDNVEVTAELTNRGTAKAQDVAVELWWSRDDSPWTLINQLSLSNVEVMGTRNIKFLADRGFAGNNSYRVAVSAKSNPLDRHRWNDAQQTNIAIRGFADLYVEAMSVDHPTPHPNDPVTASVLVRNDGLDDARDIKVEIFAASRSLGRRLIGQAVIVHIPPLEEQTVLIPIDTSQLTGVVQLTAVLDRHEKILEQTDLNNTRTIPLSFGSTTKRGGITGLIWDDNNRNGQQDAPELPFRDAFLYLDANRNGLRDREERSASPNAAGVYEFADLAAGSYLLKVDLPEDFQTIHPSDKQYLVVVRDEIIVDGIDFGVSRIDVLGDVNGDLRTDFSDFLVLSANFGRSDVSRIQGDLDADGVVGFSDFLILSAGFGRQL